MKTQQQTPDRLNALQQCGERHVRSLLHHRAAEIHQRLRLIRSQLKTNPERLIFDYICQNTLGYNKASDQIANSQFVRGKRERDTGRLLDVGCGLRSINTVRKARKSLVEQGIIFEESVKDISGASEANRYGLNFIRVLLSKVKSKIRNSGKAQHTVRGYQLKTPTNIPSGGLKQRCKIYEKGRQKQKLPSKDPAQVDYLIEQIEIVTGDTHSRGAFAKIAMSVPDGHIQELLSILKDRGNIRNPGAWFLSVARQYAGSLKKRLPQLSPENPQNETIISPDKLKVALQKLRDQLSMPAISVPQGQGDVWVSYDSW